MELLLSDEQKLLRDSAVTLVERSAGPKRARELRDNGEDTDRAAWRDVAEAEPPKVISATGPLQEV